MRIKILLTMTLLGLASVTSPQQADAQQAERLFHFTNPPAPKSLMEIATLLRVLSDIPAPSVNPSDATLRWTGAPNQVPLVDWLLLQLDKPKIAGSEFIEEFRIPGARDDGALFYSLANVQTTQSLQEILTTLRSVADVQKVYMVDEAKVIALRGGAAEIARARWLIRELDQPEGAATEPAMHEYWGPGNNNDVLRVFYLARAGELQKVFTDVRMTVRVQKGYFSTALNALIFRGSVAELTRAQQLIEERDKVAAR